MLLSGLSRLVFNRRLEAGFAPRDAWFVDERQSTGEATICELVPVARR